MSTEREDKPTATPRTVLGAPELETLRSLRRLFARGGLPPAAERSPEDDARIASFTTIAALLRLLDTFRARVARGERVGLVLAEKTTTGGGMRVEIAIEARGS